MNRLMVYFALVLMATMPLVATPAEFVKVDGPNLVKPDGTKLFIQGTNLGNWLNPEGYMFGLSRTNSAWMIDLMIKEAVGPDFAAEFWRQFKDNYITRKDLALHGDFERNRTLTVLHALDMLRRTVLDLEQLASIL